MAATGGWWSVALWRQGPRQPPLPWWLFDLHTAIRTLICPCTTGMELELQIDADDEFRNSSAWGVVREHLHHHLQPLSCFNFAPTPSLLSSSSHESVWNTLTMEEELSQAGYGGRRYALDDNPISHGTSRSAGSCTPANPALWGVNHG